MQALEFLIKLNSSHTIEIPDSVQQNLAVNQEVRVIVLIEEKDVKAKEVWQETATRNFFSGYAESDSVYDNL